MRNVCLLTDTADHGGQIVSASSIFRDESKGLPIARLGDMFQCGITDHGINPIVEGSTVLTENGIPVAITGCKTQCGASLIGTSISKAVS